MDIPLPSAGSLSVAVVALFAAALQYWTYRKERSQTWEFWGALMSLDVAAYALAQCVNYNTQAGLANRLAEQVEYTAVLFWLHLATTACLAYAGRSAARFHRWFGPLHLTWLGLLWATPWVISRESVARHLWGMPQPFIEPVLGPLGRGLIIYGLIYATTLFLAVFRYSRRHPRETRLFLAGFVVWAVLAAQDAFTTLWGSPKIFVMEYGFFGFTLALVGATAARQAELTRSLRRSEASYRDLFNNISDFICQHDLEGRLLAINPRAASELGFRPAELVGRDLRELMPPEHRPFFAERYLDVIRREGRASGVFTVLEKSGAPHYIEYRNLLREEAGQPPRVVGVGRDITERLRAEKEFRLLQEKLNQAAKMEAVGTLASGIAHDFNNILQTIGGSAELLAADPEAGPSQVEGLAEINQAVDRAAHLVRQLLAFSRRVEVRLESLDLNALIKDTTGLLERTIPRMITLTCRLAPHLPRVKADANQLGQVLLNLVANAKDALPQGGEIVIETSAAPWRADGGPGGPHLKPGDYVRLTVRDNGQGIASRDLEHIFEPFYTTKALGHGTGLGLSTVFGIVKQHGGDIVCQSQLDQGSVFHIWLPAAPSPARASLPAPATPARNAELIGEETVLVVDDEAAVREVAQLWLTSHGYTVLTAGSGEEALVRLAESGYAVDLVILDLGMPGRGGMDCLRRIKELRPEMKVVVASGYGSPDLGRRLLEMGAERFMQKPYRLKDLLRAARDLLDAPGPR
ncbi:MAG: response regulator [Deltaproteobacteria bacterium]|nr:response regulator [Deltaproteobacteria bacterium]